jgi:hypothetical protein
MMKQISYSNADKYVLAEDYFDVAPFTPNKTILTSYGAFYPTGEYKVSKGFLFSANFPAINTINSRRGAMVHDFFYSLMKDGYLERDKQYDVDYLFYNMLTEDGMSSLRAWYWFKAVRLGGESALDAPYPTVKKAPQAPLPPAGHQLKDVLKV